MRTPHRFTTALVAVTGAGLLAAAAPAAADTSVSLSSCSSWSINSGVFNCVAGTSTPPAAGGPTSCFVSPSPVSLPAGGGTFNLTGTCSGTPATSWSWNGAPGGPTYAGSASASTTVQATPFNGSVAGGVIFVPITVATSSGGGGPGIPGGISCSPKATSVLPLTWPTSGTSIRTPSTTVGEFGSNTVLVGTFTTGAKNGIGRLSVAEYAGGPVLRTAILSSSPCGVGSLSARVGVGVTMYFSIGPNPYGYPVLAPGTPYYFNVTNEYDGGTPSCPAGSSCDVSVDLKAP